MNGDNHCRPKETNDTIGPNCDPLFDINTSMMLQEKDITLQLQSHCSSVYIINSVIIWSCTQWSKKRSFLLTRIMTALCCTWRCSSHHRDKQSKGTWSFDVQTTTNILVTIYSHLGTNSNNSVSFPMHFPPKIHARALLFQPRAPF